jgi:hypothetical protein
VPKKVDGEVSKGLTSVLNWALLGFEPPAKFMGKRPNCQNSAAKSGAVCPQNAPAPATALTLKSANGSRFFTHGKSGTPMKGEPARREGPRWMRMRDCSPFEWTLAKTY